MSTGLGELPQSFEEEMKDAVHVATYVARVASNTQIVPGQAVAFDGSRVHHVNQRRTAVGIADPFRTTTAMAGGLVRILITPGTTINLRHHWDHPSFPDPEPECPDRWEDDGCLGC